ncbi:MAG: hypothetical protein SWC40_02455 [Thermodesulfobacteriota bacterium]|nr:hypothetical protein [Thermodesulfobacteriota bacterium]
MATTLEALKAARTDYLRARWENEELIMEPHCACGEDLDEDHYCGSCQRTCNCRFVLCEDARSLEVMQKFIHGNPDFRDFRADVLAGGVED